MVVLEDDPYRRIRFSGEPVPPIQSFDRHGCVIGLGTFAKLVAPGLRLGWVIARPEIVAQMAAMKADGGTVPVHQRMLIEYCRAGRIEPDIRDRVRTYQAHRERHGARGARTLAAATSGCPKGATTSGCDCPTASTATSWRRAPKRQGVQVLPASHFHATPGPRNHLRLAYSYASPSENRRGRAPGSPWRSRR